MKNTLEVNGTLYKYDNCAMINDIPANTTEYSGAESFDDKNVKYLLHIISQRNDKARAKNLQMLPMSMLIHRQHQWPILLTWFNFNPSMDE